MSIRKSFQKFNDKMQVVNKYLIIVGAINWGIVGLFGIDIFNTLFYSNPTFLNFLYVSIGYAGVSEIIKIVR
jgi:hypothetical protein